MSKVSEMPISIGFPQCCKFAKKAAIENDVSAFLRSPASFLKDYLTKRIDNPTPEIAVLVYILLSGGEVECEIITNTGLDLSMKRISLEFIGLQIPCINKFHSSINCFDGFLTIHDPIRNSFTFAHSSVHESLFKVLFYFDPKSMIKYCHHSLLLMITIREKQNSTQVIIAQDLFNVFALRIGDIIEGKSVAGYNSVSLLELWNDFNFHNFMLGTKVCMQKFKTCHDIHEDSMMVHFSKTGNMQWVRYLLPSSDERQRYNSLNVACSNNHADIVQLFLKSRVKCDLQTCFYAVQSGNLELLFQVCEFADLHQISSSFHPVWRGNRHSLLQEICLMRQTHFVEKILQRYPFLLYIKDSQGSNALHSVASSGDMYSFNLLLKFGFDPYEKDRDNGHTVLTCACQDGRLNMVKYLIEKYPALLKEHTDIRGKNLLHWAAFSGNIDMFEYMLNLFENDNILHISSDNKPKVDKTDNTGESILHAACVNGHYDMCEYLLNRYPQLLDVCDNDGNNILHYTALGGNIVLFKYLVENYPDLLDFKDKSSNSVLHAAAWGGNVQIVKLLIEKKMDINTLQGGGETILHKCCRSGKREMCEYLVHNFPDLLVIRDNRGWTVLHSACYGGSVEIVSFLIEKGMDINTLSNNGGSILHVASLNGKCNVCRFLSTNHPQLLDIKDSHDKSVIDIAIEYGDKDMIQLLRERLFTYTKLMLRNMSEELNNIFT